MDNTYVQRLIIDNEIGLALTYLANQGRNVALLMSNYNQHRDMYMAGVLSYEDFFRQTAVIKSSILAMLINPAFHIPVASPEEVKTAVVIVASKKDLSQAIAVRSILETKGFVVTITEAFDTQMQMIGDFKLVYIISKNYFDIGTRWPVSITSNICTTVSLLFDDSLDRETYLNTINQLNEKVEDISESIQLGINKGFPVGALAISLNHFEQAKLNIDLDYNYLWSNPPNDCRGLFFESGVTSVIEKLQK
jgi:hypothetical protein